MRYLPILFLLFSCYTERKATKELNKAQVNYPVLVAKKTNEWFPCVEETKTDTVKLTEWRLKVDSVYKFYKLKDTIIEKYTCQDLTYLINQVEAQKKLINNLTKLIDEKPPVLITTKILKDSAGIVILKDKLERLTADKEDYVNKADKRLKWIISLLVALFGTIVYILIRRK